MNILEYAQELVDDVFQHQDAIMIRYGDAEELRKTLIESSKPSTLPDGSNMVFGTPPYVIFTSKYPVALVKNDYSIHRLRFYSTPDDDWLDEESRVANCTVSYLVFSPPGIDTVEFMPVSRKYDFDTVAEREVIDISLVEPVFKGAEDRLNTILSQAELDNEFLKSVLELQKEYLAIAILQAIYPLIWGGLELLDEDLSEKEKYEISNNELLRLVLTDENVYPSTFNDALATLTGSEVEE